MSVTLEEIALFAEIIGGAAVIITLVYFAIEMRRNTKAIRSATHQQQVDTTVVLHTAVANDGELATLISRANDDYSSLDPSEIIRLQFLCTSYFNMWNYQHSNMEKNYLIRMPGTYGIRGCRYCSTATLE
ncbi:MAG: hypothetical protein ACI9BW_004313 [Gammaproteobacteria bacterium]|jgi:hypothetical protein